MMPRHKRMPACVPSRLLITVDPVVVMPDMLSKKASVYVGTEPDHNKGRAPNPARATQINVVITKA